MNTTYGNVSIVERNIDGDGKEIINTKKLESVSFNNIDHKWYSPDESLSPLYEPYKGRPFSLLFKINQKDKDGKPVEFEGKFKMIYKLGHLPPQDFESVPVQHQKSIDYMESIGLLSSDKNGKGHRIMNGIQMAGAAAAMVPGVKVRDLTTFHMHTATYYLLDEFMDSNAAPKLPFKLAHSYWSAMLELYKGEKSVEETQIFVKSLNLPSPYEKFTSAMGDFGNHISNCGAKAQHLIRCFKEFYVEGALENCQEWKAKQSDPNSTLYSAATRELRLLRSGAEYTAEEVLFDLGIELPQILRDSFLTKTLYRAWSQYLSLVNDVFSYEKEFKEGGSCNHVYISHVHDGLPLEQALEETVKEINKVNDVIYETGQSILQLFGDIEEAKKFVDVLYGMVYGSVQWHGFVCRYSHEKLFDCVVEI